MGENHPPYSLKGPGSPGSSSLRPDRLHRLLQAYVAPGYRVGADLLTRIAEDSDLNSNTCMHILDVLEARDIAVSEAQQQEILRCEDHERLRRWLRRAALVSSTAEVISEP